MSSTSDWRSTAKRRILLTRFISFGLVSASSVATFIFLMMYGYSLWIIVPFVAAYFALSYLGMTYFVAMVFGFFAALRPIEKDRFNPIHNATDIKNDTRIAIMLPVYHEDVRRWGAAMASMWEDLRGHVEASHFDFFILSDSRKIDSVVQEEWMVHELSERYQDGRFIYRRRSVNLFSKLGNISDFLKRWGNKYKYMMMLDADSIVPAESMIKMARMMEGNAKIGILQAYLSIVYRNTLYARISRFIASLTMKINFHGQYFFYLGQGNYFGHNAMLRTDAFIEHCGLPNLRKFGPWASGKPLSHDYVEAALMEGAGYEIWALPEIDSFEEIPTNVIDDMKREMRWMYGSMTYLRVCTVKRINALYKARLFTTAINYFNPILGWLFFLMAVFGLRFIFSEPLRAYMLMHEYKAIFTFSLCFLIFTLVAKLVLPIIYHLKVGKTHLFGGFIKMSWSYLLLFPYGLIIGPIYMAQFTRMLYHWAMGEKMHWGEQNRDDRALSWAEAFKIFWWMSALGVFLFWVVFRYVFSADTPAVQHLMHVPRWGLLFWYVPLLAGLIGSVWLVRFLSVEYTILEKMGWFVSPQEAEPHFVVSRTQMLEQEFAKLVPENIRADDAISDPWFYMHHRHVCQDRPVKYEFWMKNLSSDVFAKLKDHEKFAVLNDRLLYDEFHRRAWHGRIA